jgi:AcrR family transcriptional regulator
LIDAPPCERATAERSIIEGMEVETLRTSNAGRKRDSTIDERSLQAAIELYAMEGWSGFNFEAVARRAGVGKPAVYRRWDSREALLGDALAAHSWPIADDLGSMKDDVRDWASRMLVWWSSPGGGAYIRWLVDLRYHPELGGNYEEVVNPRVRSIRGILSRAVARGELNAQVDRVLLLETINGAIFTRALTTPLRTPSDEEAHAFADSLIGLVLRS